MEESVRQLNRHVRQAAIVAAVAAVSLAATGCASDGSSRYGLVSELLASSSSDSYPRTRAEIDALPYAQLGVVLDEGRPGIAVLAEYLDGNHYWVGSDAFELLTAPHGRVLAMTANQFTVTAQIVGADPLASPPQSGATTAYQYQTKLVFSGSTPGQPEQSGNKAMVLDCVLAADGEAAVVVVSVTVDTRKFVETCRGGDGESTTSYWLDEQGQMRRVDGQLYPGGRHLRLDALKVPE